MQTSSHLWRSPPLRPCFTLVLRLTGRIVMFYQSPCQVILSSSLSLPTVLRKPGLFFIACLTGEETEHGELEKLAQCHFMSKGQCPNSTLDPSEASLLCVQPVLPVAFSMLPYPWEDRHFTSDSVNTRYQILTGIQISMS